MNIQDRLLRLIYVKHKDVLITTDMQGRVHKLDMDLNLIQSSPTTGYSTPIQAVTTSDRFVFTRNRHGSIAKWDLETLQPLDIYDEFFLRDSSDLMEGEEPSPTAARGIAYYKGRVYANNGYSQMVVLDEETFDLLEIREALSNSFIDSFCVEIDEVQVMGEQAGLLHIGNLETGEFPISVRVDTDNVHVIRYDKRHNRFWATQDAGFGDDINRVNGIATINLDGTGLQTYPFTNDDVEFLEIDEEARYVYVGGFDGHIYVFDNEDPELKLSHVIGPLPYILQNLVYASENRLYVLIQNGELICIDRRGEVIKRANYSSKCVWDLSPHPEDDSLVYAATDQDVQLVRYGVGAYENGKVELVAKHRHTFGILRRVRPFPDGSYVAIGRKKVVFRADKDGNLIWYRNVEGYARELNISYDYTKLMVCTDQGHVLEFNAETGAIVDRFYTENYPAWVCGYTPDGRRIIGVRNSLFTFYAADSHEVLGRLQLPSFPKRLLQRKDTVYAVGGFGLSELDLETYTERKNFNECLVNTRENGCLLDGHMHIVTYGYQLASFNNKDTEINYLIEGIVDIPKAITGRSTPEGEHLLLIGGRSGFLNLFRVVDGIPQKLRETYLV